jgi:hypothetical protein
MNQYWWAYGIDATGQIAVAGEYDSQAEAESDASARGIVGLQGVVCLPTKNMASAKQHIKYIVAKNDGNLNSGMSPMRSI